jgi:glycosyltransferase involved in cell wall biosynthesis
MLTIGYVQVGAPHHGVRRRGRLVAAEARRQPGVEIIEAEITLGPDERLNRAAVRAAARRLRAAHVVHIQYNSSRTRSVWGRGWRQIAHLWLFQRTCGRPLVATVHDFYPRERASTLLARAPAQLAAALTGKNTTVPEPMTPALFASEMKRTFGPDAIAVRWLARRATILACSHEEERRIRAFAPTAKTAVIPHFVEDRPSLPDSHAAKVALGLNGHRIVTLLGFIHARKGHGLLLEALAQLPPSVVAVFAGGARDPRIVEDLLALARSLGVAARLHITGYLPEDKLEQYLAATDLAVCPFYSVAASGSLTSWISAGRPILASDLPLIAEYNAHQPGAIQTFAPLTSHALAAAIRSTLERPAESLSDPVRRLQESLRPAAIIERHLELYRRTLDQQR